MDVAAFAGSRRSRKSHHVVTPVLLVPDLHHVLSLALPPAYHSNGEICRAFAELLPHSLVFLHD